MPSAMVNASSWTAVEPASRIWYPEIDTACQRGTFFAQNSIMSVTILSEGRGGLIHSFCAMDSLNMSSGSVPATALHGTPWRSATTRYIASSTEAEQLIVIEVETLSSGMR